MIQKKHCKNKGLVLCALLFLCATGFLRAQFRVVGYLPKYTTTLADHINAFDFTKLTHLNVAFFNPDVNGNFPSSQGTGLDQIVTKAHLNNVKVLISIAGGSNQSQYANLLLNANRAAFINKLVALVSLYNVDGIDVDLEGDNIDSNYESFVTELADTLHPSGKLLTAALAYYTRTKISDNSMAAFDFVNLMAYDQAGKEHSPYTFAKLTMDYWRDTRGVDPVKLTLGVPFYGYYKVGTTLMAMTYKDMTSAYPGAEDRDTIKRSDGYVVNYNGKTTIMNKTALALAKGGGVMIWQLLQDDITSNKSLLKAIDDKIHATSGWNAPYLTWKYDLATKTGNAGALYSSGTTAKSSTSKSTVAGFLPYPPYGSSMVFLGANTGASFLIDSTTVPYNIKAIASSGSAPSKFTWYNVYQASPVTAISFKLGLNAALTNGQLIIPFGYSNGTINSSTFSGTNQLTSTNTAGVFGAIRLDFYGGNFATLSFRNTSYGYTTINSNVFNKVGTYDVELYCNNTTTAQSYTKNATAYSLPSQKFNIWVNGTLQQGAASLTNFSASGELPADSVINSFTINTSGNSGTPTTVPPTLANSLQAKISNVDMKLSFMEVTEPGMVATLSKVAVADTKTEEHPMKVMMVSDRQVKLIIHSTFKESSTVVITDYFGKIVSQKKVGLEEGYNEVLMDVRSVLSGLYVASSVAVSKKQSMKFKKI